MFKPVFQIQDYLNKVRPFLTADELLKSLPEPIVVNPQPTTTISTPTVTANKTGSKDFNSNTIHVTVPSRDSESSANKPQKINMDQLKFFFMNLLFNDDEFKDEFNGLIKEVFDEEMHTFKSEIDILSSHEVDLSEIPFQITDLNASRIIFREFPKCSTFQIRIDDQNANILKCEEGKYIFEIFPSVTMNEINRIINMGKLYKRKNPLIAISAFIISNGFVPNDANDYATRMNIKIFKS